MKQMLSGLNVISIQCIDNNILSLKLKNRENEIIKSVEYVK